MQGHRGIIGSHSEILDFDHGSTSANPITDPQIRWNNNVSNPADGRLADLMLSPNHLSNMYGSSAGQEQLSLGGWNSADPCSSGAQNVASYNEQKMEQGWSSSASARSVHGSRLEGRHCEPVDILSLDRNCPSVQSFNSNAASQNINLNAAYVSQVSEGPGCSKSGGSENQRTGQTNGADAQFLPSGSGSGGYLVDESDGRAGCSLDGRRKSCKRKAIEGSVGQCSISESSSFFQHSGNNGWPDLPAQIDARSSLNMSGPSEQASSRLRLGMSGSHALGIRDSSTAVRGESSSSRRNFRLRVNPSSQESVPATLFPSASSVQHSIVRTSHPQSQDLRFIPNDNYFDFGSSSATEGSTSQGQQVVFLAPALPQNVQSFRLSESSNVRPDNSSRSGDRNESSSVATARNLWDHQVFVPATEVRTSVRNSTVRSVNGGNISFPGNVASTSRAGLGSSAHPVAPPTWYSVNPPQRNSRRLAEYVRRALFSTSEAEPGGQSSTHSPLPGPTPSVEGTVLSSGMGSQGHHRSYPRSGTWIGRHGDGVVGIPYPLRTLSSGEGRSRMVVSEIRNVLDLMRRGENLRLEDVMILDQSVFFGVPDIHDRHRDMRMDVDNMTYEELLALEERIGNVSTGLNEETILNRLKQKKFEKTDKTDVETEPCCVCQEEYNEGDAMGMLDCGHDFHTECIKQWLKIKNWCPICKMTGLST